MPMSKQAVNYIAVAHSACYCYSLLLTLEL